MYGSIRAGLVGLALALLAGFSGASDGFWIVLPGVLLIASEGNSKAGAVALAAPVVALGAGAVLVLAPAGSLPPWWMVVVVPLVSVLVVQHALSRLRRERERLERAALSDPLTGIANRRMLLSVAAHEIARHRRSARRFTVVMIDLDGFKPLNDRFGHAAGDEMLRAVADQLVRALRSQDTVARFGGDEFCVLAPETAGPESLTGKIGAAVANASAGNDGLRASLGTAVFPDDGTTLEKLLERADQRLLAAKRRLPDDARRRAA
jgi:diguanylate cyclase (GGDEF)-like protein